MKCFILNRSYSELYMIILVTVMSMCIKDYASELHMTKLIDVIIIIIIIIILIMCFQILKFFTLFTLA